jgi:hypothetical protein
MGNWDCPHNAGGKCAIVNNRPCEPGMKGCVLFGRFTFADPAKNRPGPKTGRDKKNGR